MVPWNRISWVGWGPWPPAALSAYAGYAPTPTAGEIPRNAPYKRNVRTSHATLKPSMHHGTDDLTSYINAR